MVRLPKIQIQVPGTSANLGPGFDLMGMSLGITNRFSFSFPQGIEQFQVSLSSGDKPPFSPDEDLVLSAYTSYFQKFLPGTQLPFYQCRMHLELPLKGGLGSSASAIVCGLCLGREVHRRAFPDITLPKEAEFLQFLAEYEGHPDNTLPAYLGGFVFAYSTQGERLRYFRKRFPNSVSLFILTPEFSISTEESRKTLPKSYPTVDVIFNLSRIGAWMHFLEKRKFTDLLVALEDRMHTPYRTSSPSPLFSLCSLFQEMGIGYCLSGSGPSLLLFLERKHTKQLLPKVQERISSLMGTLDIPYRLLPVKADHLGVRMTVS